MSDLSVRGIADAVLERLREQARAEGVSVSEWVRVTLADRAALPTPSELAQRRAERAGEAQPADAFDAYYRARLHRRRSA